ncbi:MAG TPA: acyl-CoA reductase [Flavobacteriaceae bacterium]|nr:acyl-CoA reductase [Flavobacteriaceae bacterium]
MTLETRITAISELGRFLRLFSAENPDFFGNSFQQELFYSLSDKISEAVHHNGWFTKENVLFAINQWGNALTTENLKKWLSGYKFQDVANLKTVGIIMAGNVPLVGFHDFLSVLLTGHKVQAKLSSNDKLLLPIIAKFLIAENPEFANRILFSEGKLENFDAVIATGSNNTARYFEHYFSGKPNIIRKNRNSIAVLTGDETKEELMALAEDIFRYYGLGCRNVSKLYVPENYDFSSFFQAIFPWNPIVSHAKYANNYDYNKAVYLMSEFKLLDNGFLLLKEDTGFGSPIAVLFYEKYSDESVLKKKMKANKNQLQCIVSNGIIKNSVEFGKTQFPELWDYADGVDTIDFLTKL